MIDKKAYDFNKKVWHSFYQGEIHHTFGGSHRSGVGLCCLHFFEQARSGHQDNWSWVEGLKEKLFDDFQLAKDNYDYFDGCRKKLFSECEYCYFFSEVPKG